MPGVMMCCQTRREAGTESHGSCQQDSRVAAIYYEWAQLPVFLLTNFNFLRGSYEHCE